MRRTHGRFFFGATIAVVLLLPPLAKSQSFGAREQGTSLNGARLTYYPRPNLDQCQSDCANNANCKGYTWIQAGTYNPADPAMCYLMSSVTGRAAARGHFSSVKGTSAQQPQGYVGCFRDTSAYDLNGFLVRSRTNTPEACIAQCRQRGFAFAGVQYGESCLCGNSYGKYGASNACTMPCTGNPGVTCGGYSANAVYATGLQPGTGGGPPPVGGNAISTAAMKGFWQFSQCDGLFAVLMGVTPVTDTTFEGGFENGNGSIKNGRVSGNTISFTRFIYAGQEQQFTGQIVNEGGRLKITGMWTGYAQERCAAGRNNWTSSKAN